jgi:hypothetical protein
VSFAIRGDIVEIDPADPLGVNAITSVMLSRDERTLVFNYRCVLSELFVAAHGPLDLTLNMCSDVKLARYPQVSDPLDAK